GKTAVACHLVQKRQLPHHLVGPTGGRSDPRLILRSLLAQLIPLAGGAPVLADTVPELTQQFEGVLGRAASPEGVAGATDGRDGLPGEPAELSPFLVGDGLPEGVYFVVTSRPGDRLARLTDLLPRADREEFELGALELPEMATILRARRPGLADG